MLKTLSENLSETSEAPPAPSSSDKGDTISTKDSQSSGGIKYTQIQILKLYWLLMHQACFLCLWISYCLSINLGVFQSAVNNIITITYFINKNIFTKK